jgi:beta-lactamase regulating signal transducer with metallopeptidase domain
MTTLWEAAGLWPVRAIVAGGVVLLAGRLAITWTRQPARRVWIGTAAVVAALLAIPLSLVPGWLTVSVPTEEVATVPASPSIAPVQPPKDPALAIDSVALADLVAVPPLVAWEPVPPRVDPPTPPAQPAPPMVETPAPATSPSLAAAPAPTAIRIDWPTLAAWGYALVAGGFVLRLLGGHMVLSHLWRRAHPAPAWAGAVFRRLAAATCPRAELRVSARPVGPVCFGILRPRVLIPAGILAAGDGPAFRAVLAHELAHLCRRDPLAGWLLGLARAAYFVCPWLAGVRREVRIAQECLADAEAAEQAPGPADYADLLIRMARSRPAPLGAAGARGPSSELYRRVIMLLRTSGGVERRCPRRWALGIGGGLTALAILAAGLTVQPRPASAAPTEPEKKEPAKKDAPPAAKPDPLKDALEKLKKDLGDDPDAQKKLDELIGGLKEGKAVPRLPRVVTPVPVEPPGFLPGGGVGRPDVDQEIQRAQDMMQRYMQEMTRMARERTAGAGAGIMVGPNGVRQFGMGGGVRLGVRIERPSDVLTSQLDLPAGQGQVLTDVPAESVAGKAGLKPNDILLEIGGKSVSSNFADFHKTLADIKPDTAVDVVVMRKGKKETIKGVKLPEPKPAADFPAFQDFQLRPPVALPVPDFAPQKPLPRPDGVGASGETTRVEQVNDAFTVFHAKDGVKVTIAGTKEGGVPKAESIEVDDHGKTTKAESIDKLPKEYQGLATEALKAVKAK